MKCSFASIALVGSILALTLEVQAQPYYVAGTFNGWDAGSDEMSGGPTTYNYIITNGTAGTYTQFKITDGTFNNTWPAGNVLVLPDAGGSNTVYFTPGLVTDGWLPLQNRVGYGDTGGAWEVAGDFTTPNWASDPTAQMTTTGNGLYTLTYVIATAGTHIFKFRTSGTWNDSQVGTDFAGSDNASVTTTNANQSVLFQLDLPNGRWLAGNPAPGPVTNQVIFSVDMSVEELLGRFNPATDTAFVSGNFNGWAGIGAAALVLTNYPPLNGDTNIFYATNTIVDLPSTGYLFKFTDNDPAWSGSSGYEPISQNRTFNLLATNGVVTLPTVMFGNALLSDYLPADTTVTFTVNMTNAVSYPDGHVFDPNNDSVFINGNFISGGWTAWNPIALNQMQNDPVGSQIYTFTYVVPKGSPVLIDYKYGMAYSSATNLDNEAAAYDDHFRYVRSTATDSYTNALDTFGNQYVEPEFGQLSAGAATGGNVSVSWLGRPGVHLQVNSSLVGGTWQDLSQTDGTNWTTGYTSTNGFVSQTNWPNAGGHAFFRLIKP